ncbi:unnamed protein product [Cyprideis torosa]|uniref:Uncharacterized protein n=1 Tax=Cyprideis torosa TaxID=163714 RepID=A0A7R8WBG3_9CRUS|nr:unnamed protein product [Cyprideis torosa]CAG0890829.1 unnamed protein product [Cyprideis torosa]
MDFVTCEIGYDEGDPRTAVYVLPTLSELQTDKRMSRTNVLRRHLVFPVFDRSFVHRSGNNFSVFFTSDDVHRMSTKGQEVRNTLTFGNPDIIVVPYMAYHEGPHFPHHHDRTGVNATALSFPNRDLTENGFFQRFQEAFRRSVAAKIPKTLTYIFCKRDLRLYDNRYQKKNVFR